MLPPSHRLGHTAALLGLLALVALSLVGCGGSGGGGTETPTAVTFTHSPLAVGDFAYIQPLGNLNPPGHTFPTDHIYFYFTDPSQAYPVYAPADGTITSVLTRSTSGPGAIEDHRLNISHGGTLRSYLDHVATLDPALAAQLGSLPVGHSEVSVRISAGQRLGSAGGGSGDLKAMDLGTYDTAQTLPGLTHPAKYYETTAHATAPLSYYAEPLRSVLYSYVRRSGDDKDGRIDFDVSGRLVGNWFAEGATVDDWTRQLAFVYDPNEPSTVRVSLGGELGLSGVFAVPDSAPRPADVDSSAGPVAYQLRYTYGGDGAPSLGLLLAEVTGPETIRVELFVGSQATTAAFTSAARTYSR